MKLPAEFRAELNFRTASKPSVAYSESASGDCTSGADRLLHRETISVSSHSMPSTSSRITRIAC